MMIEIKKCENCGHNNPVIAVECEKCGYDLTFVFPQKIEENSQSEENNPQSNSNRTTEIMQAPCEGTFWGITPLSNEDDFYRIDGEVSVGRDCDIFNVQFNTSNFTSRVHAKLRVFENQLQVMDASTNGTFVDDKRIPKMEWLCVCEGSIIKFADVSFKVQRQ